MELWCIKDFPPGFSCPPLASSHVNLDNNRHENVTFALYLPDNTEFQLPSTAVRVTKNEHDGKANQAEDVRIQEVRRTISGLK